MKVLSTEPAPLNRTLSWLEVERPTVPPHTLTDLNYNIVWAECPVCLGMHVSSVLYSTQPKRYGYYCHSCNLIYIADIK